MNPVVYDNSYGFLYSGFRGPRDFGFDLGGFGFFAPGLISGDNGFLLLLIGILHETSDTSCY